MLRALARLAALAMGLISPVWIHAFSLQGEYAAYHVDSIGYTWGREVNTIGGPMNIGEEYRWNEPNIYYTFDESFLNYFGQRGVDAVESAMRILNDLPSMNDVNIDSFPLYSQRVNYQAQALRMIDVKSIALQTMVEELGLGDPTRYVFTLRSRWTANNGTSYLVIKRNFDPVTLQPSSYINGALWTYLTIFDNQDAPIAYPVNRPVDPLVFSDSVATGFGWTYSRFTFGTYYTGLTRDDVGGLRYVYNSRNYNVEDLGTNTISSLFPGSGGVGGGGGGGLAPLLLGQSDPWGSLFVANGTFSGGGLSSGFQPWGALIFSTNALTNTLGGGVLNTNNTPQNATGTIGLRPGVGKLTFRRLNYDSLLGQLVDPILDTFADSVVLNGRMRTGVATRIMLTPDIIISAADLSGRSPGGGPNVDDYYFAIRSEGYVNLDQQNGTEELDGPGVTRGPVVLTYNSVGPFFLNAQPSFLGEGSFGYSFVWGSFDSSTNAPTLYPLGASIRELENLVGGAR